MVYNPLAFATPQQKEQLAKMQVFTQKIQYVVHTDDKENRLEISLKTEDPEAAGLIPQLLEGMVSSTTQMMYQLFAMQGERV